MTHTEKDIYFTKKFIGYGHWKITAVVDINGRERRLSTTTTDAPFIDSLETYEEKQKLLFDKFYIEFEDIIKQRILEDEIYIDLSSCNYEELNNLEHFTGVEYTALNNARKCKNKSDLVITKDRGYKITEANNNYFEVDTYEFINHFRK